MEPNVYIFIYIKTFMLSGIIMISISLSYLLLVLTVYYVFIKIPRSKKIKCLKSMGNYKNVDDKKSSGIFSSEVLEATYSKLLEKSKNLRGETYTTNDDIKLLMFEYEEAQKMLAHYDNLNWEIGSILIGSNIVALGFIASATPSGNLIIGTALGGISSLTTWIMWYFRHAYIYNVKNDRLYIIESKLKIWQHRMVNLAEENGWLTHVDGWIISFILWFLLSLAWVIVLFLYF